MNKRREDNLQIACVSWFRLQYPNYIITSFPAGYVFEGDSTKRAIIGKRMKDMGYCVGIPDVFIPVARKFYHGLYVEFKAESNRLTQSQTIIIDKLMRENYYCAVCYSVESFMKTVNRYFE